MFKITGTHSTVSALSVERALIQRWTETVMCSPSTWTVRPFILYLWSLMFYFNEMYACAWLFQVWQDFQKQAINEGTLHSHVLLFENFQDHKQICGKPFNCECIECGKDFGSKHILGVHKRSCGSFDCLDFKYTFTSKMDLNCHIKSKHPYS